jgi:hypothetical protein
MPGEEIGFSSRYCSSAFFRLPFGCADRSSPASR